jgi:hypothetical protein
MKLTDEAFGEHEAFREQRLSESRGFRRAHDFMHLLHGFTVKVCRQQWVGEDLERQECKFESRSTLDPRRGGCGCRERAVRSSHGNSGWL